MKGFRKFIEHIVEGLLRMSGWLTSLVILLIIVFLFKEGSGLFGSPEVEKGYALCMHASNPVERLTAEEIKDIFNGDIQNWQEVGGARTDIKIFRFDDLFTLYSEAELGSDYELIPQKLGEVIAQNPNIIAFIPKKYIPESIYVKQMRSENITLSSFLNGREWLPTSTPAAQFGLMPLILGTLWVSIFAIVIALPFGLAVSIYLSELANERIRSVLKPAIELLAGIPSVVYGFFGLVVLVPLIQQLFSLPVGETAFAGSLILAIMALPTIISIAEDAMRNTPKEMREASLGLGATHWQTIYRVVIPYSSSGITAAVVLGIGRAIGETMAVLMVTGNAAVIPTSLFAPVRTIPATIAAELGEAASGGSHYQALFMLGCVLFMLTMLISVGAEMLNNRRVEN
jgi:phosphate transport system permease protein